LRLDNFGGGAQNALYYRKHKRRNPMTTEQIFERVQMILVDQLSVEKENVTMNANFIDDLNADSLDIVELVMAMEQEFDISIPDEEAERIRTVGDAINFIKTNV
jgi:acyl carrier protein